ncbi:MAG: hypothetical protein LAT55_13365 [Opitutales bacterium]|nr:hypothetical protein [Opitutales bacterium]
MPKLNETDFEKGVANRLVDLLGITQVKTVSEPTSKTPHPCDFLATAGNFLFVVECKQRGDAATIGQAIRNVLAATEEFKKKHPIPLVVVPYMGEVGRRLCEEAKVSWLDLSGNASLTGRPGLRIQIEGKPNQFKTPGRPQNLFAPKSSRIARSLLLDPGHTFSQRELAERSRLDEGFTSRIVRAMEERELVRRNNSGAVSVIDPEMMLAAWRETYNFNQHTILRGHVATRSGTELLRHVAKTMKKHDASYAATGLAGTWLVNKFAGFRLTVLYLDENPTDTLRTDLGFREETRGANLWLVRPNDAGVFHGAREVDSIRCVHPVQLYLDLKNHPERATEAAESLKPHLFKPEAVHG